MGCLQLLTHVHSKSVGKPILIEVRVWMINHIWWNIMGCNYLSMPHSYKKILTCSKQSFRSYLTNTNFSVRINSADAGITSNPILWRDLAMCFNPVVYRLSIMWQLWKQVYYVNGLVEDCSNSIALAMELLQSCTKPLQNCNNSSVLANGVTIVLH